MSRETETKQGKDIVWGWTGKDTNPSSDTPAQGQLSAPSFLQALLMAALSTIFPVFSPNYFLNLKDLLQCLNTEWLLGEYFTSSSENIVIIMNSNWNSKQRWIKFYEFDISVPMSTPKSKGMSLKALVSDCTVNLGCTVCPQSFSLLGPDTALSCRETQTGKESHHESLDVWANPKFWQSHFKISCQVSQTALSARTEFYGCCKYHFSYLRLAKKGFIWCFFTPF